MPAKHETTPLNGSKPADRFFLADAGRFIAVVFAAPFPYEAQTSALVAVGSRSQATADKFGDGFNVARRYASYQAMLADRDVQAVYISLPNHLHAEWVVHYAEAGNHILCEKPFTVNHAEAMAVIEAVRARGVFLMEAFLYRCHPQTAKLVELVRGGGIMDVGTYCMSLTRLLAAAEPLAIKGVAHIGAASRVDEYATAVVKFPGNLLANLSCGTQISVHHRHPRRPTLGDDHRPQHNRPLHARSGHRRPSPCTAGR